MVSCWIKKASYENSIYNIDFLNILVTDIQKDRHLKAKPLYEGSDCI